MAIYAAVADEIDRRNATINDELRGFLAALDTKLDLLLEQSASLPKLRYSPAETAVILGCSVKWLSHLEEEYGLKSHRNGRNVYYSREELERFVREQGAVTEGGE